MRLAFRLARRELRGGIRGLPVVLLSLALGVGAIAGVESLSRSIEASLTADARAILGGDLEITLRNRAATAAEKDALHTAGAVSETREMRSMAHAGERVLLVELKTVDRPYPLYGAIRLEPPNALPDVLAKRGGKYGAAVEPNVLARLGIAVGDSIRIGEASFEVRAAIEQEPDRSGSLVTLGPRVLIAAEALPSTELLQPGSIYEAAYRVRFGPNVDPARWLARLKSDFPDAGWRIRDPSEAAPRVRQTVERLGIYLTLVGLSALLIGGVGVANAIKSYLDRRVASIATLKCLGASNGFVLSVYLIQVLALAAVGIGAGLVLGALFPFAAAPLLAAFMPTEIQVGFHTGALLVAAAFGLLTTLVFAAWPLLSAAAVPPRVLFRAVVAPVDARMRWRDRAIIAGLTLALTALAVLAVGDPRLGFWFALGALVSFGAFRLAGAGLARLAAAVSHRRYLTAGRPALRLGLGNMHRPGAALPSVVLSLGIGLTVLVAVALVEANMTRQVKETMPADAPAFFFIDIQPNQVAPFEETVHAVPGAGAIERVPHLRGRIVKLNGVSPEDRVIPRESQWIVRGDRGVTYAATPPEGATIVAGEWWPADYKGPPLVSFDADAAAGLGLKVGDTLTINVLGREIEARIANLRRIEWTTLGLNFTVILSPGVLEKAPQTHVAAVMADPAAELQIERAVADRFANISAIRVKAALEALTDILNRVATALDAAAAVTLIAGLLVLASAVAAGQERRIYDAVVLKVLGATRRDVLTAYAVEFGLVGLATALVAAVLGSLAAYGVLGRVMRADWVLTPGTHLLALIPALLPALAATLVAGAVGSVLALRRKPAPLLRNE